MVVDVFGLLGAVQVLVPAAAVLSRREQGSGNFPNTVLQHGQVFLQVVDVSGCSCYLALPLVL